MSATQTRGAPASEQVLAPAVQMEGDGPQGLVFAPPPPPGPVAPAAPPPGRPPRPALPAPPPAELAAEPPELASWPPTPLPADPVPPARPAAPPPDPPEAPDPPQPGLPPMTRSADKKIEILISEPRCCISGTTSDGSKRNELSPLVSPAALTVSISDRPRSISQAGAPQIEKARSVTAPGLSSYCLFCLGALIRGPERPGR